MTDNHRDEQMSDDVIMIYADGGLTPEQREVVREALSRDPELMQRYESFVFTRAMVARPFDSVLSAPVPDKLLRVLKAPGLARAPGAGASAFARLLEAFRMPTFSLATAIPALVVAAGLGWVIHYTTPVPPESGGFAASGALQQALESTPRGSSARIAEGVTLQPTYTFATARGAWCRQFEVTYAPALRSEGMACRKADGAWNIIAQTDPGPPAAAPAPGKFAPAAGADDGLDALRARIKQGDVLDRNEEQRLIEQQWSTGR